MAGEPLESVAVPEEEPLFVERVPPTKAEVYNELLRVRGNISEVARTFACRRKTIKDMIERTPELLVLVEELREGVKDKAEDNIFVEVEKGSESASRFVLGSLGKDRGWAQGVEGTGKGGAITIEIVRFSDPS